MLLCTHYEIAMDHDVANAGAHYDITIKDDVAM